MTNLIYIRRRKKILIPQKFGNKNKLEKKYITTLLKNIEPLGYALSKEVVERIETFSLKEIKNFHNNLVKDLKVLVGDNVEYKPMYPNFPRQVMNSSEFELFVNAQMHYFGDWVGKRILPQFKKIHRPQLKDKIKLKILNLGTKEDFQSIFTNLLMANTSISDSDKKDIEYFVQSYKDQVGKLIPKEIPLKENVAVLDALLIKYTTISEQYLKKHLKTATDILRLITAYSDGDVSLATNTKFKSLKRSHRTLILGLLEKFPTMTEDMLRYPEKWKRVGEYLHPSEYAKRFPKVFGAFDVIRNNKNYETFNGRVENLLIKKDVPGVVDLLKDRPGELARRLDHLLRISPGDTNLLIDKFESVVSEVSSRVLLQIFSHFKHRNKKSDIRIFFPKGNLAKVKAIKNSLPELNDEARLKMVQLSKKALIKHYKSLGSLGKVYVDKQLENYTVPFALRSTSKALKTVGRGSRIEMQSGNTVRFFIWWKDGKDRTDIDLSAIALDDNYKHKTHIAYYNLKDFGGYHSGDITSAPQGASEFIDIDIDKMTKSGVRYILMTMNSFTLQPYSDLPECFAGFMMRNFPNSGEIYDPRTVENKFDISSDTRMVIPLIVDLKDKVVIWTDMALKSHPSYQNNVFNNMSSLSLMSKSAVEMIKPNLYELFTLHAEARGELVKSPESADTIFSLDKGITPHDIDQIIARFL